MPEPPEADDTDLVHRIATEPAALEELYRRHVRAVLGYATRRIGDPVEAADVVAGVFLEVVRSARRYEPGRGSPRAWIFGIAANLVAAHGRRRVIETRALQRVYGRRDLLPDDFAELADRIDAQRSAPLLRTALAELAPAERELFLLVSMDGLSPAEAAAVLGIAAPAARMRLARARRRLRGAMPQIGSAP
ncbi:RNA polymerase sigma factor [Amycolatopsis sp. 195334CR]|uniref:RNA polymerase sigma factor n=1 Tax=Amycolatopsis sp. 195334CR TaxID=2814588 RepID=UPI001A8D40F7|nr:sigma-70 family RNA polymerase sigma factor [Amycolatopsis sp. 195334CR]MBN6034335.1 sigma-70 family RNA polymerase sigma factor [Amycolatopsis sp. 195334CR]